MTAHLRQLAIFDVDGTLTRTVAIDAECFVRALELEFGLVPPHTDWAAYVHTTDGGITREIFEILLDRLPDADELGRLERRFVRLLEESANGRPHVIAATPGAQALLHALRTGGEWDVAIATGAWQASALFKLRIAGVDIAGLPAAFSEDGEGRDEIVRAAWERARLLSGGAPYARVVSIGDAIWDLRTARRLGLPFLGVAVKGSEDALRAAGATRVIPDFRDVGAVLRALAEAT
jgi:phosphoglycolate phosphatase-like HAD superfamily hydrolase